MLPYVNLRQPSSVEAHFIPSSSCHCQIARTTPLYDDTGQSSTYSLHLIQWHGPTQYIVNKHTSWDNDKQEAKGI